MDHAILRMSASRSAHEGRPAAGPPGWTVAEDRGARATDCTEDAAAVTAAVPARRRLVRACALNRAGGWAGRDSDWTSRGRAIFPRKHTPLRREEPRPAQTAARDTRLRPLARRRDVCETPISLVSLLPSRRQQTRRGDGGQRDGRAGEGRPRFAQAQPATHCCITLCAHATPQSAQIAEWHAHKDLCSTHAGPVMLQLDVFPTAAGRTPARRRRLDHGLRLAASAPLQTRGGRRRDPAANRLTAYGLRPA